MEVLTGLTLDAEHGTIQVLDNAAWRERRQQLEQRGGPPETGGGPRLDPIPFGTDPIARGRVLIERGQWDEAEAAFDEVVRARPYNASSWIARGGFRIARGQPERASADFAVAIRLEPENLRFAALMPCRCWPKATRPACDKRAPTCSVDSAARRDPETANLVAWFCVLGPDSVADREAPVRLAELAVNGRAGEPRGPIYLNTLGAALYRAGRFEESIRRLEEAYPEARWQELYPRTGCSWPWLIINLGIATEARRWLDRFQTYKANEKPDAFWDELEIRLLRTEAEALILYDPVFPADPFAH